MALDVTLTHRRAPRVSARYWVPFVLCAFLVSQLASLTHSHAHHSHPEDLNAELDLVEYEHAHDQHVVEANARFWADQYLPGHDGHPDHYHQEHSDADCQFCQTALDESAIVPEFPVVAAVFAAQQPMALACAHDCLNQDSATIRGPPIHS